MDYLISQYDDCYPPDWFLDDSNTLAEKDVICSFCLAVFREPVQDLEGHIFGKNCLISWLKSNNTCPVSNQRITKNELYPNKRVVAQIKKLNVKCPLECDWRGILLDLDDHLIKQCQKYTQKCKNEGCEVFVPLEQSETHSKICAYKRVQCPFKQNCGSIRKEDLSKHIIQNLETHQDSINFFMSLNEQFDQKIKGYKIYDGVSLIIHNFKCGKCNQNLNLLNRDPNLYHSEYFNCDMCGDGHLCCWSLRCAGCDYDVCLACNFTKNKGVYCKKCPSKRLKRAGGQMSCDICSSQSEGFMCMDCKFMICKRCRSCIFE